MSRIRIELTTDNSAFSSGATEHELGRILARFATELSDGSYTVESLRWQPLNLLDVNGNRVGTVDVLK